MSSLLRKPAIATALTVVSTLGAAAVVSPCSAAQRSIDARGLDIAGVKTGMGYEEAAAAVASHLGIPRLQLKPDPFQRENPVTRTRLPSHFSYEKDGIRLIVHFEGRVPVDKTNPLAVSQVIYEVPWSQANVAAMTKAALEKYGEQSNAPNALPMQWCEKPSPNPGMGCAGEQQAMLELSQVRLQLTDPAWRNARIQFVEEARTARPNF